MTDYGINLQFINMYPTDRQFPHLLSVLKMDHASSPLPILNSIGTSRGSSRMFSRLFLRQQRAGYVYN